MTTSTWSLNVMALGRSQCRNANANCLSQCQWIGWWLRWQGDVCDTDGNWQIEQRTTRFQGTHEHNVKPQLPPSVAHQRDTVSQIKHEASVNDSNDELHQQPNIFVHSAR